MKNAIEPVLDHITAAFIPKPMECRINGNLYLIERVGQGWSWRNEDGDCQEDFGILPFAEAWQCQQSAVWHVQQMLWRAV